MTMFHESDPRTVLHVGPRTTLRIILRSRLINRLLIGSLGVYLRAGLEPVRDPGCIYSSITLICTVTSCTGSSRNRIDTSVKDHTLTLASDRA